MRWMPYALLFLAACLFRVTVSASPPDAPLADAVERMDGAAVQLLLQEGVKVNAAQVDGMTALHWAVHQDDLDTVRRLLQAGADANLTNRYGVTPLSLACTNGSASVVEALLDAGADPQTALPGGEAPLMTAARTGEPAVVRLLLSRGADVTSREARRGQTALMWAAAEGHARVVRELLRAGADFRTPLDSGFTPLLFAVREGRIEVVLALLEAGVDANETVQRLAPERKRGWPSNGISPLHVAVANAHYDVAAVLLDRGADPNADLPGYTALHRVAVVRKPGVGDNNPPPEGSGSLDSLEFVRRLAGLGANLDARMTEPVNLGNTLLNKLGATPFFLAAQSADAELMRTLADLGADPRLSNADNTTPLMAIAGIGTRSPGEDAGTEPEMLEALRVALDLGAEVNAVDDNGETAMHGAAYKNAPAAVQFLVDQGANIEVWNRKNRYGWTPLMIAQGHRHGNFKPSPDTLAALHRVMIAAGVTP